MAVAFATLKNSPNVSHAIFKHGTTSHSFEHKRTFIASNNVLKENFSRNDWNLGNSLKGQCQTPGFSPRLRSFCYFIFPTICFIRWFLFFNTTFCIAPILSSIQLDLMPIISHFSYTQQKSWSNSQEMHIGFTFSLLFLASDT